MLIVIAGKKKRNFYLSYLIFASIFKNFVLLSVNAHGSFSLNTWHDFSVIVNFLAIRGNLYGYGQQKPLRVIAGNWLGESAYGNFISFLI